jgi:DNA helicase HerA-like ATPase
MTLPSPVDPDWYLGTVTQATANQVFVNLPQATARPERRSQAKGAVGDFVFIDCERLKVLGRIIETRVADSERLTLEPHLGAQLDPNPVGRVQLLAGIEQGSTKLQRGLSVFPRIGDGVYLANPSLLGQLLHNSVADPDERTLDIGRLDAGDGVAVSLPPEKLFGRHCGVFGATGGGKSWTLATLIQQLKSAGGKAIVFDPTGEFAEISGVDQVFGFEPGPAHHQQVHFPYRRITEDDLFSLLRPSAQSQGPKLREAITSLKLVAASNGANPQGVVFQNGQIIKQGASRSSFIAAVRANAAHVHSPLCNFDITNLADQIKNECVRAVDNRNPGNFGTIDDFISSNCETLITRVNVLLHSKELSCIFQSNGASLADEIDRFIADDSKGVALISFRDVRFEHNTREVLLNIIGRHLLNLARQGQFKEQPLVVFLDEAHQFLGRVVGDEYGSTRLDAFGLIAKEGRKYGLTCVLATQRPRDIPQDVLSQLGTLFVHRLTNDQDRETVERACGDLDRGAAQFIPMLAPGEAVLIGPDLPAPVPIIINRPASPPDSKGPAFQAYWKQRRDNPRPAAPAADQPIEVLVAAPVAAEAPAIDLDDEIPF